MEGRWLGTRAKSEWSAGEPKKNGRVRTGERGEGGRGGGGSDRVG